MEALERFKTTPRVPPHVISLILSKFAGVLFLFVVLCHTSRVRYFFLIYAVVFHLCIYIMVYFIAPSLIYRSVIFHCM